MTYNISLRLNLNVCVGSVETPNAIPNVGDFVTTLAGQGIIRMTYPNGQFGVELEGGRSFSAWSASEITVLRFGT